jgi:DNA topoisomerase-2
VELLETQHHVQTSCKEWENKKNKDSKGKNVKRRQATLQTRKSLPGPGKRKGGDNESEDEFMPTKAAKAKKPTEPKQVRTKPTAVVPSKTSIDIDDDVDDVPLPKKRAPAKKAKDESESDFEVVKKPAARTAKAKAVKIDSDSEVEVIPAPPAKGKGKAKEAPKRKR